MVKVEGGSNGLIDKDVVYRIINMDLGRCLILGRCLVLAMCMGDWMSVRMGN